LRPCGQASEFLFGSGDFPEVGSYLVLAALLPLEQPESA
jgi:hypothetical protein